ncbi:MAG: hypothetical protein KF745_00545 [Phycisphaeraceae bacterium]|nr:hypothetical protein [Phycisphaeraceae bacterium]
MRTLRPIPAARRRARHRGSIGLAMVIVLIIVQLTVIGVVTTGVREQDITIQRLDTLRAFYAAEGGMNMAIREMMNNVDEDGDGVIGTISDDGNAANDPALAAARLVVTKSISGPQITLTSQGRSGIARRKAQAVLQ